MGETKNILQSKTLWTNLLAPLFLWAGTRYGIQLDPETQAAVIVVVMSVANIVLRAITHQPVTVMPSQNK